MERSFYLDDYADEIQPCAPTLEGWAEWLSKPDEAWEHEIPADGKTFDASATRWEPDIIATRIDGQWSLSRDPGDVDFLAVRFGQGMGWSCDQIINIGYDDRAARFIDNDTATEALLRWLEQNDEDCDDTEFVAVGYHEGGWRTTYHAKPQPHLTAERVQ